MPSFIYDFFGMLSPPSRKDSASYAYLIEALDIVAALLFVAGSVCFLPRYSKDPDAFVAGCNMFVVASVQYVVISCLTLAEALQQKGTWTFEALENCGWVVGSVIFLIGSILYFPERETCEFALKGGLKDDSYPGAETCSSLAQHMNKHTKAFYGTIFFILGSVTFVIAIFINAMNQRKFSKWQHWMVATITFNYLIGSILFCMGSIAFLPNVGCGEEMVAVGAWMFIFGSVFFFIGALLSLRRTQYMIGHPEEFDDSEEETLLKSKIDGTA